MTAYTQRSLFDTISPDRQTWWNLATDAIYRLIDIGAEFNADTVRTRGVPEPPHPNMWGPVFAWFARRHLIVRVNTVHSIREDRKGSMLSTWIGAGNG